MKSKTICSRDARARSAASRRSVRRSAFQLALLHRPAKQLRRRRDVARHRPGEHDHVHHGRDARRRARQRGPVQRARRPGEVRSAIARRRPTTRTAARRPSTFVTATVNSTRTVQRRPDARAHLARRSRRRKARSIFVNVSATRSAVGRQSLRRVPARLLRPRRQRSELRVQRLPRRHAVGHQLLRARAGRRRQRHQGAAHDRVEHDERRGQPADQRGRRQQRGSSRSRTTRTTTGAPTTPAISASRATRKTRTPACPCGATASTTASPASASSASPASRSSTRTTASTYQGFLGYWGLSLPPAALETLENGATVEKVDYSSGDEPTRTPYSVVKAGGKLTKYTRHARTLHEIDQIKFTTFVGKEASTLLQPARRRTRNTSSIGTTRPAPSRSRRR